MLKEKLRLSRRGRVCTLKYDGVERLSHLICLLLIVAVRRDGLESDLKVSYPVLTLLDLREGSPLLIPLFGALHFEDIQEVDKVTVAKVGERH